MIWHLILRTMSVTSASTGGAFLSAFGSAPSARGRVGVAFSDRYMGASNRTKDGSVPSFKSGSVTCLITLKRGNAACEVDIESKSSITIMILAMKDFHKSLATIYCTVVPVTFVGGGVVGGTTIAIAGTATDTVLLGMLCAPAASTDT